MKKLVRNGLWSWAVVWLGLAGFVSAQQDPVAPEDLVTETFLFPPIFMEELQSGDPFATIPRQKQPKIAELLADHGIPFPNGSSAQINPTTGQLIARNIAANNRLVEELIQSISSSASNEVLVTWRTATGADEQVFLSKLAEFFPKRTFANERSEPMPSIDQLVDEANDSPPPYKMPFTFTAEEFDRFQAKLSEIDGLNLESKRNWSKQAANGERFALKFGEYDHFDRFLFIDAIVRADEATVELEIEPQEADLSEPATSEMEPAPKLTECRIEMPVFATRKTTDVVTIWDGQTVGFLSKVRAEGLNGSQTRLLLATFEIVDRKFQ